jgi:hypothetical protein
MKLVSGRLAVCGMAFFAAGCQHLNHADQAAGRASYQVVETPEVPPPIQHGAAALPVLHLGETRQTLIEAYPNGDLASPTYPPAALAAHAGWVILGVRITIDTTGRVSDVQLNPLGLSNAGRFTDDFLQAVAATVRTWTFFPAHYRYEIVRQQPGGGLYWSKLKYEATESFTDLSFNFTETTGVNWKQ